MSCLKAFHSMHFLRKICCAPLLGIALFSVATAGAEPMNAYSSRIIGGSNAAQNMAPYQVSIATTYDPLNHLCGGAILNNRWVLTAGHCCYNYRDMPDYYTIVVGANDRVSGGQCYEGSKIIIHKNFEPSKTLENDIALMQVKDPFIISKSVQPIALTNTQWKVGEEMLLTGWGVQSFPDDLPARHLQMLRVKIVDLKDCRKQLQTVNVVFDNQVCTFTKNGQGPCAGDSGGPLIRSGTGGDHLVGLVSWGKPCADGYPDVYTSVYSFISWINENMK